MCEGIMEEVRGYDREIYIALQRSVKANSSVIDKRAFDSHTIPAGKRYSGERNKTWFQAQNLASQALTITKPNFPTSMALSLARDIGRRDLRWPYMTMMLWDQEARP
jgi:hypothetical protein